MNPNTLESRPPMKPIKSQTHIYAVDNKSKI